METFLVLKAVGPMTFTYTQQSIHSMSITGYQLHHVVDGVVRQARLRQAKTLAQVCAFFHLDSTIWVLELNGYLSYPI